MARNVPENAPKLRIFSARDALHVFSVGLRSNRDRSSNTSASRSLREKVLINGYIRGSSDARTTPSMARADRISLVCASRSGEASTVPTPSSGVHSRPHPHPFPLPVLPISPALWKKERPVRREQTGEHRAERFHPEHL
ncbi:MAG: hypothetical protein LKK25_01650, partial [Sphaerochaeta sp.]|nr:hypothetical protein [Sphaerochaeta sp.]